ALAARVVHAARQKQELIYFEPVADTPGFARALATTIREVRLAGVDAPDLVRTGKPGQDLALLLRLYLEELEERSLADLATLFEIATEVAETKDHRLVGLPLLLLDVALDSQAQRLLVDTLSARSPAVLVASLGESPKDDGTTLGRLRRQLFSAEPGRPGPL